MSVSGELDRSWTELVAATLAAVEAFAAVEDVLQLFAAAVFALHQDTIRAYAIDMSKAASAGQTAAIDAAQPTPLGNFAKRIDLVMTALRAVESANAALLSHPPPGAVTDEQLIVLSMARLRTTAAQLWRLTLQARAVGEGGPGLLLGVTGMWTRLQTVPREALPARAAAFTGTFYRDVRSDPMDYAAWPLSP